MFNRVKYFITKNIKQTSNYRDSLLKNIKTPKKKLLILKQNQQLLFENKIK